MSLSVWGEHKDKSLHFKARRTLNDAAQLLEHSPSVRGSATRFHMWPSLSHWLCGDAKVSWHLHNVANYNQWKWTAVLTPVKNQFPGFERWKINFRVLREGDCSRQSRVAKREQYMNCSTHILSFINDIHFICTGVVEITKLVAKMYMNAMARYVRRSSEWEWAPPFKRFPFFVFNLFFSQSNFVACSIHKIATQSTVQLTHPKYNIRWPSPSSEHTQIDMSISMPVLSHTHKRTHAHTHTRTHNLINCIKKT